MKSKVLLTGKNTAMIGNFFDHLSNGYKLQSCQPKKRDLMSQLESFQPQIVVLCLADESQECLNTFREITGMEKYHYLPLLLIGNEEDCNDFTKHSYFPFVHTLIRPIHNEVVEETINQLIQQVEQVKIDEMSTKQTINSVHNSRNAGVLPKNKDIKSQNEDRKHILVVDDDIRMLKLLNDYLKEDYEVAIATSGSQALSFLATHHTDLVLLDYVMPEKDGPSVLKDIRENEQLSNLPVIFLTGVSTSRRVKEGLQYHPQGYLLKPIARKLLLERLAEVFNHFNQ